MERIKRLIIGYINTLIRSVNQIAGLRVFSGLMVEVLFTTTGQSVNETR